MESTAPAAGVSAYLPEFIPLCAVSGRIDMIELTLRSFKGANPNRQLTAVGTARAPCFHVLRTYSSPMLPTAVSMSQVWNRLRQHRARSVVLSPGELVEVRAAQRTFEGAYIRTALSQFSFSLVVLKIFTAEFYSIGALFAVYGVGIMSVSLFRRQQGNKQFFSEVGEDGLDRKRFRTSGNVVLVLTALSVAAYSSLLYLTLRLQD
ncbi:MAG: hypothetical protein M1829_003598 [Trizodia sp. TS-e1964]|nr:MAG: hypothetical protein M1829_003598 [Trizodia sp. TS-e1964]